MVQCVLDIVHRSVGHAAALEDLQPFLCGPLLRLSFNQSFELCSVLDSLVVRDEFRVRLPFGLAQLVAEDAEETVVSTADEDVAVGGLEALVRDDGSCSFCQPPLNSTFPSIWR